MINVTINHNYINCLNLYLCFHLSRPKYAPAKALSVALLVTAPLVTLVGSCAVFLSIYRKRAGPNCPNQWVLGSHLVQ